MKLGGKTNTNMPILLENGGEVKEKFSEFCG